MTLPKPLEDLRQRPGMCMMEVSFPSVAAYIQGYDVATAGGFLAGFREWLIVEHGGGNNLAWPALVLGIARDASIDDDERITESMFELLERFLLDRAPVDGLRRIFARYETWLHSQEWYTPSSPHWIADPSRQISRVKDMDAAHPIASNWRSALCEIVRAFTIGDYSLSSRPANVMPVEPAVVEQVREYVADYGETLVELPEDTWITSRAQWMGSHWEILVDLWTAESGPSDLVLSGRVFECAGDFRIEVESIYVP